MKLRRPFIHASIGSSCNSDIQRFSSKDTEILAEVTPFSKRPSSSEPPLIRSRIGRSRRTTGSSIKSSYSSALSSSPSPKKSITRTKSSVCSSGYHSFNKRGTSTRKSYKYKISVLFQANLTGCLQNVQSGEKLKYHRQISTSRSFLPPRAFTHTYNTDSGLEIWKSMVEKEKVYTRDPNYFVRQKEINPEMRKILINWMREVCYAYNLDLETLFLAVDFLDRFLSAVTNIPIYGLQTIGTTCLYIAAKLNEIHQQRIEHFANVTDGASSVKDIIAYESYILLKINWHLQPITPLSWLKLFLKICNQPQSSISTIKPEDINRLTIQEHPNYHGPYTRMRKIKEFDTSRPIGSTFYREDPTEYQPYVNALCSTIIDHNSLRHSYGVIAASILYTHANIDVFTITGYGTDEISACTRWLKSSIAPLSPPVAISNHSPRGILSDRTNTARTCVNQSWKSNNPVPLKNVDKENIQPNRRF